VADTGIAEAGKEAASEAVGGGLQGAGDAVPIAAHAAAELPWVHIMLVAVIAVVVAFLIYKLVKSRKSKYL
jgi:membrane protein implicated in regulation of membrane protease activity